MLFPFLALLLVITLLVAIVFCGCLFFRRRRPAVLCGLWLVGYGAFLVLGTGPTDLRKYPPRELSAYRLPWKAGVTRFVAQGNRSFTSHRRDHLFAWDFVMANGTEILAARSGKVVEVEERYDGIGLKSNYVILEHPDWQRSTYAHIRRKGSLVRVGDEVNQGDPVALSGMVGPTVFPHVHFYVTGRDGKASIPISFRDVPGGVPLAGHFYTSQNGR